MASTGSGLPEGWAEQWRREKEKKKKVIEGDQEGAEQDKLELRAIVAYNDSRIGLMNARPWKRSGGGGLNREGTSTTDWPGVRLYRSRTYPEDLFLTLKAFLDSSLLADLTLQTEDGRGFRAHSPVLAAVSLFIQDRLRDGTAPSAGDGGVHQWSLCLGPEVNAVGLRAVLEFAYTGAASSLNKDNSAGIRAAARALGVSRLLEGEPSQNKEKEQEAAAMEMQITLRAIEELRVDRLGCDVALDVDGVCFHAHRVILAASSAYFRGMFTCGMRESRSSRVALPFHRASELEALISCSYSGSLQLDWDGVFELACTALQLQLRPAVSLCLRFMRQEMEAGSCLDVASFAEAYGMSELHEEAYDFVLRNFLEVSATEKFCDLEAGKLLRFLCDDGLCVPSELVVFRAVVSWVQADPEERLEKAGLLMKGVRFHLMTFREFREVRAVNLRMECSGDAKVDLQGSAFQEFCYSPSSGRDRCRVRRPKDTLVLVGGDKLNPDEGWRIPCRELWFANALRSHTGLVKDVEWRKLGAVPDKPRFRHGAASMGGRLYVVGGCYFYTQHDTMKSAFCYDPAGNSWLQLADMQELRSNFSLLVHRRRLYAIGGDKEVNTNVASVEVYDDQADSWSYARPLAQALSGHAAAVLDDQIFISGGFDRRYVCLVSTFLYAPEEGSSGRADMTHERAQHCMEALRGRLYAAGGVCNQRGFYTDLHACEMYDPVADSWTGFASLPVPHVGAASAVLEDRVYILGGYSQEDYSEPGLVHRFEPRTGRWENVGKLPGASSDLRASLLRLPTHLRVEVSSA